MKYYFSITITIFVFSFVQAQQPMLDWAKSCNGLKDERVNGIAVDGFGNVYTTGSFEGTVDFDSGVGVANLTSVGVGDRDAFVCKYDVNGNFVWVKQFGENPGWEEGMAITVDAAGNVYTTGMYSNIVDFDPGAGIFNLNSLSAFFHQNMYVSKLDTNGNFVFAKRIGGQGVVIPRSIALDTAGNIYTTGEINSAGQGTTILTVDFDPDTAVFPLASTTALDSDVFISKLDASGNFVWAKNMGSNYSDGAYSIALDSAANVYITGVFRGTADFDPSTGVANLINTSTTYSDIFVAKYDTNANYIWAKRFGSNVNSDEWGFGIRVDALGNVYSTGTFAGTVDFDPNGGVANIVGGSVITNNFISKLDTNGNYIWAKSFSGNGAAGRAIDLDSAGNVYTIGYFYGTCDFDPNAGVSNLTATGGASFLFVSKLDSGGNYVWARHFGNTLNNNNNVFGQVLKVDANFNIHTAGTYNSTVDFDPCPSIVNLTNVGQYDVFVQKLKQTIDTPTFNAIPAICSGTTAPVLPTTSTNGISGTWSPATVSSTASGTYTFTPGVNECTTQTATLSITVNPNVTTTFTQIPPFCSNETIPVLPTTSTNGIVGTWNPATVSNIASGTYVFTPNAGQCGTVYTMNITVNTAIVPTFTQVAAICAGDVLPALPTTSNNGITGTWSPALNNMATTTYTFTPSTGVCATNQTMTITVNSITPTFTQVASICSGDALSALPTTSNNGVTGTWSPALDNTITKTYTFTPTIGQCAIIQTMTITVNTPIVPTFASVNPICTGGTLAALPTSSNNGIVGTWSPALNNMATTLYTFTPNAGQCATNQTLTITVSTSIIPIFTQIAPICSGSALAALPTVSNNGISGTWSPSINNSATTTYTFTPATGQCAVLQTMTIVVNAPTVPMFTPVSAICVGDTLSALPTTSNNGITGTWSPALNNMATTTYTFTPTTGICATNQTMTIVVNSVTPLFTPIEPICLGDSFSGLPTISDNGITGTWSPAPNNLATTTYTFTPNLGQCAINQTMTVTVNPFVQLSVSINQLDFFNSENQPIEVTVSPVGTYAYSLDGGTFQTSNIFENVSSCEHKIVVKDLAGCGKSNVEIPFFVWDYPRFFSPNNDGINDYWNVYCNDYKPLTITIYDRYGKLLNQFLSTNIGWDGKYNGSELPSTDYWFTVEYIENGVTKIFKSHFAMKR